MTASTVSSRLGVASLDELDLGALGRALWRRRRWIVGLTLAAAAISFTAVNLITPRYKSEARVLIETRENIFFRPEAEKSMERGTVDQEAVASQVQLILSRDLARDVVRKLKLGERPEFDPVLRGTSIVRVVLGLVGLARDPTSMTPEERVLQSYFDRVSAYQVEKSRVIAIEFSSEDPELAARVANAIAENYLLLQQTAKQVQARAAGQWLSGEIDGLRTKVEEAEAKVEQYRSKANLFMGNNNTTLSNQQLGDFNTQFGASRAQRAEADAKAKIIRDALRTGKAVDFSEIMNSELMRRLSEQRITLLAQLAEQSSTLLSGHPRIKELRAQVGDLERQMRIEAERIARTLESDAKVAAARVEALSSGLDQLKRQATSTNEHDVQLRALEREAKSQRDLLESYLAKFRDTSARDNIGAASPDARIISGAAASNTPAWPKKLPIVLMSTLAMLVLSVGFVLTGELLSGAPAVAMVMQTPGYAPPAATYSASAAAPAPAPAAAPAPPPGPSMFARIAAAVTPPAKPARSEELPAATPVAPSPPAVGVPIETIEGLAQELGAAGETARRIAVVGATRNIGTTFAAITLARSLAKEGRVVLVDLALSSPNLSVIASDPSAPGITDVVRGVASFGQIITRDKFSRVHLIQAGLAADAQSVLSSQRLAITLEALARSYDHVVVDAGALPDLAAERFAQLAPRAVLVAGKLDDPMTLSARERLMAAGFSNISVLSSGPRGPERSTPGTRAAA
jgi:succinoglycan biosynthesis transport protein ExoP